MSREPRGSHKAPINNKVLWTAFLIVFLAMPILSSLFLVTNASSQPLAPSVKGSLDDLDFERIKSDVSVFSSMGSRVTGYEGNNEAAEYIKGRFNDLGLKVQEQEYYLPIPIDEGSKISWNGSTYEAYALWPHAGLTAERGNFTGMIYYVKDGDLEDMNGLDLRGAIVLMDFNSGNNWINAAKLGAKAVVLIEPTSTTKYEALAKGSLAPIYFPRLYVDRTVGNKLVEAANSKSIVTLTVNMSWKNVKARNIIGIMEGDSSEDVVILSAHYDSWSITPVLSPAGEDAIGVSTLLELARYFKEHKPKRTVWFVAYSGHWQGRAGGVVFTEKILLDPELKARIWMQIGIDISSETPYLDCLYLSSVYGSMRLQSGWGAIEWRQEGIFAHQSAYQIRLNWIESIFKSVLEGTTRQDVGNRVYLPSRVNTLRDLVKFNFRSDWWSGTQTDYYMLDTEPSLAVTSLAVTLRTQYARRMNWLSPLDPPINWKHVKPQITAVAAACEGFVNYDSNTATPEANYPVDYSEISPKRMFLSLGGAIGMMGFATVYGRTVEFNSDLGWYSPIPNALVRLHIYNPQASNAWPFAYWYTMSDENGSFEMWGLIPYQHWQMDAWKISETDGRVTYALDAGFFGTSQGVAGGLRTQVYPLTTSVSVLIPLFRCAQVTLFDLVDTRAMRGVIIRDYRNPNHNYFNEYGAVRRIRGTWGVIGGLGFGIYEAKSKASPGFIGSYVGADGVACAFLQEGTRVVVTLNPRPAEETYPMMVLSNSSKDNPEGDGFVVSGYTSIPSTLLQCLNDTFRMINHRYGGFLSKGVRTSYAEQMLEKAKLYFDRAVSSFADKEYDKAYDNARIAIQYFGNAYGEAVMPLFNEAGISIVFFASMIFPFAILFERMIFRWEGIRRFVGVLITLITFLGIYSIVHPAFSVMPNSFMTVISVGILLLLVLIIVIFGTDIKELMETIRVSMLGEHVFRKGRVMVALHTLTTSVENMRRRPLLTVMAFVSIICFTAAQTAFTSTSYGYSITESITPITPPYPGVLVKNVYGMPPAATRGGPLDMNTVHYLQGLAGEDYIVSPRVWFYPQPQYPEILPIVEFVAPDGTELRLPKVTVMGISSEEIKLIFQDYITGFGAEGWIGKYQCILPKSIADRLGVDIGDKIYVKGIDADLTLVGTIYLSQHIIDFDSKWLLPIDPTFEYDLGLMPAQFATAIEPTPQSLDEYMYVPWELALERGGFVSSVALIPKEEKTLGELKELGATIVSASDLMAHIGYGESLFSLQKIFTFVLQGWNAMILVLTTLVFLSMANLMIGTIVARKREISIYSTLGLSPSGVVIIFLTEGITVASGGTLIGFLLGFGFNQLFIKFNLLPPDYAFNFVSLPVILSMAIIIGTVLAASLYPSYMASKLVTPSLLRKWRASTRPKGDRWELSIPLRIERFEAVGILRFFKEYFTGAGVVGPGFRVTEVSEVDTEELALSLDVILTPVEHNVAQTAIIKAVPSEKKYQFVLILNRKSGDPRLWEKRNRSFIDDIRKQALVWKSLVMDQRRAYIEREELA